MTKEEIEQDRKEIKIRLSHELWAADRVMVSRWGAYIDALEAAQKRIEALEADLMKAEQALEGMGV